MSSAMPSLRSQWDQVRRAWRASPCPVFFAWWRRELLALLPLRWQRLLDSGVRWHLLEHGSGVWQLRHAGAAEPLARFDDSDTLLDQQATLSAALRRVDPEDLRLALCVSDAVVLRRTLQLPPAARDNLLQVASYEIDRQTPFRAEQVYFAVRELPGPLSAARVAGELVAIPRTELDPLLARLRDLGVGLDAVDVTVASDRLGVNLLPSALAIHRPRPQRRLNLILAAAALGLLGLVLGVWLHQQQQALADMQAQVADMRAEAQQVASLRQQLQDNVGAAGFLAQRKQHTESVLALLLELTRRLPDSAWLERFSVDDSGKIGVQGQSKQAAKLIDDLKDSKIIGDPSFQGSIQQDPGTGKERFYIVAQRRVPATSPLVATPAAPASSGSAP